MIRNVFAYLGTYAKINKEMRYKHHAIQEQTKSKMV